ncbi:hypothetical protein WOLCODRAFT_64064 [Wolfiporia cocos MD-104 SS10]|uniref:Uncharacterized protein n=1 Tax=Wolfiporia cocos (strain MD-104) TaxID=742152 RepID=A0A2H3IWM8_WOLCO|nr:hypothetical protein WOLCODRAFT_64064 [Wolfiporia cocos MD-104 SS10]
MDPSPGDIGAVFLHPPFRDFPGADRYLDGLTYDLMNENPDWFLDPVDFRHEGNTNPNAIDYPQQLEPGRKKKSTGQASAEEPRYRCTFCRRSYAGVNAKSMWRRHVFEKHKIGMWNRRDPQDRKGGRNANSKTCLVVWSSRPVLTV